MNEYAAEVERINGNVASTYTALSEMGATMPAQQNSDNLPETVRTVPQGGSKTVQTDWNQTDETAPDYLKNKPFGDFLAEILPETEIVGVEEEGLILYYLDPSLLNGDESELSISFDGKTYVCEVKDTGIGYPAYGNLAYLGQTDTGEPFCLLSAVSYGMVAFALPDNETHSVSISGFIKNKIDPAYLPGSVALFTDMTYLYEDYSLTENKRITYQHLSEILKSGRQIYVSADGLLFTVFVTCLVGSYGYIAILNGHDVINLYTAEYTPTT